MTSSLLAYAVNSATGRRLEYKRASALARGATWLPMPIKLHHSTAADDLLGAPSLLNQMEIAGLLGGKLAFWGRAMTARDVRNGLRAILVLGIGAAFVMAALVMGRSQQIVDDGQSDLGLRSALAYGFTLVAVMSFPDRRRTEIGGLLIVLAGAAEFAMGDGKVALMRWAADVAGVMAMVAPVWVERFRFLARNYSDVRLGEAIQAAERRSGWSRLMPQLPQR